MTPQEQAVRLLVAKVLVDIIGKRDRVTRDGVVAEWTVGDRLNGKLVDRVVGTVTVKKGARIAKVTDVAKFEAWVKENRPTEWEMTAPKPYERVRPAFLSAVIDGAKKIGVAVTKDGEQIPGITVSDADPQAAVSLADDAEAIVRAAWETGELWEIVGSLFPQLEAGPGEVE